MGKRWRKYEVGRYRLGTLRTTDGRDEAVVCWKDDDRKKRRYRLGAFSELEGRTALDSYVGRVEALKARDSQTVGDVFKAYVVDREKDGKLVATFRDNWKALGPRFASMKVSDITSDVCRDYAKDRMDQGRSAGTIWTELGRLRSALNWAFKRRVITTLPYVWLPSKPAPKQRVLTQDEVFRLHEAAHERHMKVFIALGIGTGGRTEAILGLTWPQVDFEKSLIDLREKTVENPLTKKVRKGRAIVPMSDELRAILQDAHQHRLTDHVVEWNGAPIKKIRKGFTAAVERAGLGSDVTPHTLRHTVASLATDADVSMLKISRFLGHRDTRTTERIYAKSSADSLKPMTNVVKIKRA
jgi:integrase